MYIIKYFSVSCAQQTCNFNIIILWCNNNCCDLYKYAMQFWKTVSRRYKLLHYFTYVCLEDLMHCFAAVVKACNLVNKMFYIIHFFCKKSCKFWVFKRQNCIGFLRLKDVKLNKCFDSTCSADWTVHLHFRSRCMQSMENTPERLSFMR